MSTNFYAHWRVGDDHSVETVLKLHIGKRSHYGLSTMNGQHFPTKEAWKTFLRHNTTWVTVCDESGVQHNTEEFIREYIDREGLDHNPSDYNIEWLKAHGYVIHNRPVVWEYSSSGQHWVEDGQLFYNGVFS